MNAGAGPGGPLAGRTIAVTRAREQAGDLAEALARLGATVIAAPAVTIDDPPDFAPLDRALDDLARYDWLVVTSANAIPRVLARMHDRGMDPALLAARVAAGLELAVVGPSTAASLGTLGFPALVLPQNFRAEGLVALLAGRDWQGKRVFVPRALEGRDVLPAALRERGAGVDVVPAYVTRPYPEGVAPARAALVAGRLDAVTLTSGAIARAFVTALGADRALLSSVALASIGPVTTEALAALGLTPTIEARMATAPGLVAALVEHFAGPVVDPADSQPGDDT